MSGDGNASDSGLRSVLSDHMPIKEMLDIRLGTRTRTVRAYYYPLANARAVTLPHNILTRCALNYLA
jgi:hypothetical protein